MTHDEQRKYLIQKLLDEDIQYKDVVIPEDVQQQKLLLRSLMNVRPPKAVSREFMEVQDNYLSDERDAAGVVDAASLPVVPQYPRLVLWQSDITVLNCDAIVMQRIVRCVDVSGLCTPVSIISCIQKPVLPCV